MSAKRKLSETFVSLPSLNEERLDRIYKTIQQQIESNPIIDVIVFSGDVFDKRTPLPEDYDAVIKLINRVKEIYNLELFILAGNHDDGSALRKSPLYPLQHLFSPLWSSVIDPSGLAIKEPQIISVQDVLIALCPWGTSYEKMLIFRESIGDNPGIMFMHLGVLDGIRHWTESELELANQSVEKLIDLDIPIGIGHYHGQTNFGNNIWYCGSLECFNFGEEDQLKGCLIWEFNEDGVTVTPHESDYYMYKTYDKEFLTMEDNPYDIAKFIRIKDTVTVEEYKDIIAVGKKYQCLGISYNLTVNKPKISQTIVKQNLSTLETLKSILAQDTGLNELTKQAIIKKHNEIETFVNSI